MCKSNKDDGNDHGHDHGDDGDDNDNDGWRTPHGGKRTQREAAFKLISIHFVEIQNWGDADDLWQTSGPFSDSQARQLQAAVLISNCWG